MKMRRRVSSPPTHSLPPPRPTHTHTLSPQPLRASPYVTLIVFATYAKYLLFPGTFYRQALVPQLLFVSVQGMKKKKEKKEACCHLQRAHHCSSSRPWLSDCHNETNSHTLSEDEKKKNVCALEMRTQN